MRNYLIHAFVILCWVHFSHSARILAVLHAPSYSHFIAGGVMAKELASKGHEVTVVSPFPQETTIANYRDIELKGIREFYAERLRKLSMVDYENQNVISKVKYLNEMGHELSDMTYKNDAVKALMKSGESFDLVIIQQFVSEALYGLCHFYGAPCVAFSMVGSNLWTNRLVGNIGLASYVPSMLSNYDPKMTFFERLLNLANLLYQEVVYHTECLPKLNKVLQKYVPSAPYISDLVYNVSLVLLNSHPALTGALPLTPNMVEIGGLHLQGLVDVKLPEDVKQFLDKHDEGVVYFALGSNFRSKDLPPEKLQAIFTALKKYGKPVLWKFEGELPEKMDLVKVAKWFPQTAVLAHKNVKAFITHCGRLSSLESLYYGVPMIGISLFAEQAHNAAEMVHLGYALWIKFKNLNADNLYDALIEITSNSKYSNEAKLRSRAMRKENAIEKAIYWIEHVIEFKGATYLRNAGIDLPWYQFWMVDVVAFLIVSTVMVITILCYLLKRVCRRSISKDVKLQKPNSSNQKKTQ